MKILHSAPGEPTIIELPSSSSLLAWDEEGNMEMLLSEEGLGDDEEAEVSAGVMEATLAMIALRNPDLRARVVARFERGDDEDSGNDDEESADDPRSSKWLTLVLDVEMGVNGGDWNVGALDQQGRKITLPSKEIVAVVLQYVSESFALSFLDIDIDEAFDLVIRHGGERDEDEDEDEDEDDHA